MNPFDFVPAWRVDFNLGLSSFESNIRGLRNLIELALTSQARLVYTSSIGVFQSTSFVFLPDFQREERFFRRWRRSPTG